MLAVSFHLVGRPLCLAAFSLSLTTESRYHLTLKINHTRTHREGDSQRYWVLVCLCVRMLAYVMSALAVNSKGLASS